MLDAYQRFLGVDSMADAATLLGIEPGSCTLVQIETALRDQLARVYQHPEGRSEEAEQIRQALRNAAEEIKQSISKPFTSGATAAVTTPVSRSLSAARSARRPAADPPLFNLTTFDRLVLAVLVGYGGWNARSRDRLVALASSYGVSVQGLMRVVQGLGSYARAGGPPLGVNEIASGRLVPQTTPSSPGTPVGPALLDRLAENLGNELRRGDPWPTIKLSIIFGIATLVAAIISLRILLNSDKSGSPAAPQNSSINPTAVTKAPIAAPTQSSPPEKQRLAQFPKQPTFLGNALPVEAVNAADQCSQLPAQFDDAARKLSIADEPSEAIFRNWEQSILLISTGWVLADASSRSAIDKAMFEALRAAADSPTVSDRLLASLTPPTSAAQPLDVWRGAWLAGTLGKISAADSLPPVVAQRARSLLETALSQNLHDQVTFELAAGIWLDRVVPPLVSAIGFEPRTYDFWELWISAQRALGRGDRHDRAVMNAIANLLATDTDLSRPGPAVDVLGRLLSIAMENRSLVVKQGLQELFDSPKITGRDLWVLTSLMASSNEARWFPANMVLPDEADPGHRGRIRDDLEKIWPRIAASSGGGAGAPSESAATGRGITVDAALGERWAAALDTALHQPLDRKPESLMRQLITISRLIEAADALANQNHQQAENALAEIDAVIAPPTAATPGHAAPAAPNPSLPVPTGRGRKGSGAPVGGQTPNRAGQPIGRDGEFAAAYQQVGKNAEQRLELLRGLRTNAGTDLGPIDAELLVREAYRGSPQEVRATAQSLIPQQFITGPIIAMEVLDQFSDAGSNDAVSEMIQALTGAILPPARSSDWAIEARHALVRHALSLRPDGDNELDGLSGALIDSYSKRLASLKREPVSIATPRTPQAAAELLVQVWMDKAALAIVSSPVPDDFAGLQRRHMTRLRLADGPIQNMVAHQLAILDLVTYVTVAEQPSARAAALEILHQSSELRSRLGSVLEQSVEVERAIAQMWRIRMGLSAQPNATDKQRTSS